MVEMLRTLRFDRMRAIRALAHGSRSALIAAWSINHRFYMLNSR
jgi:hypothetical protein